MRLLEALDFGVVQLKPCSGSAEFETMTLLEEVTHKSKEVILSDNDKINEEEFVQFKEYLSRRIQGEPLQYIIGRTNFLGIDIFTKKKAFIPRPETELMTYYAILELKKIKNPIILEIGTGTGVIAISMALKLKEARIFATDISEEALQLCMKNIQHYKLEERITLIGADSLEPFKSKEQFNLIISNPPYIPEKEMQNLDPLVKREPELALNGGMGGIQIINRILKSSPDLLRKKGILFLELDGSNIPHLKVPKKLSYLILDDEFGRKRILKGIKK